MTAYDGRILERDEIDILAAAALDGCDFALPKLIETHLRMFYKSADKYKRIIEPDEAVAIMVENVIEKFPVKYNPDRGNFTKFAKWYAFAGIQWYLRFRHRAVHFPIRDDDAIVSTELCSDLPDRLDDGDLPEVVLAEHRAHVRRLIRGQVKRLSPLEREIVRRRFGFTARGREIPPETYKEIGIAVGYSYERVRQILNQALDNLEPYLDEVRYLCDYDADLGDSDPID